MPAVRSELKPDSSAAHYNLGQLLQFNEHAADAISEYRTSLRLRPDFPAAHVALGAALGDAGNLDAAIAEFRAALRIEPQNALARKYLDYGDCNARPLRCDGSSGSPPSAAACERGRKRLCESRALPAMPRRHL